MQGLEFLSALRKRWIYLVVPLVLGLAAAAGLNFFTTPVYKATATVYFSLPTYNDSGSDLFNGSNYTQKQLASYASLATQPIVLNPVIDQLGLHRSSANLAGSVNTVISSDTVLVDIEASDGSAATAARIANAVAAELGVQVLNLAPRSVPTSANAPATTALAAVKATTVGQAQPPSSASSPKKTRNLVAGGLAGLILGLLLALGREKLDNRVRTAKDLPAGVSLLGNVGYDKTAKKFPVLGKGHRVRAEAFRKLRTNLQFVHVDKPIKVIVVTSSIPEEGKSSTAANLAIVFAEAEHKVLLIEGDMRRPKVSEYLGLDATVGLSDVLAGQVPLSAALQKWGPFEMAVLPSGTAPPNPSELLGSHSMLALMETLRSSYDLIIVDTPPLLPVTDAAVIAAHADGTVIVSRYGKVNRANLAETVALLSAVEATIFGAVINMVPVRGPNSVRYKGYEQNEQETVAVTTKAAERHAAAR